MNKQSRYSYEETEIKKSNQYKCKMQSSFICEDNYEWLILLIITRQIDKNLPIKTTVPTGIPPPKSYKIVSKQKISLLENWWEQKN